MNDQDITKALTDLAEALKNHKSVKTVKITITLEQPKSDKTKIEQ